MKTLTATSIGQAAMNLQLTVAALDKLAVKLGIVPAMYIDGVKHFSDEQIETIRKSLADRK